MLRITAFAGGSPASTHPGNPIAHTTATLTTIVDRDMARLRTHERIEYDRLPTGCMRSRSARTATVKRCALHRADQSLLNGRLRSDWLERSRPAGST
jgi:hypothetical protein